VIAPIDRYINVPNIAEGLAQTATGDLAVTINQNAGAGTTVISNVACIHAREIVVMVQAVAGKIDHVYLDIYGASRAVVVTVDLGNVGAGTKAIKQYLGGAGQTYDVRLVPLAAADLARAWTCAR